MAPVPPNSTNRLFIDYTSASIVHTMMLRYDTTVSSAATYAAGYATIFSQLMREDDSFFAARVQLAGESFSLPLAFTPVDGILDDLNTYWTQDPESVQLSMTFRGTGSGHQGRVEFFSPVAFTPWPSTNRYNTSAQATIEAFVVDFIDAAAIGGELPLLVVTGDQVAVNNYCNIRSNSYWQNKQRRA